MNSIFSGAVVNSIMHIPGSGDRLILCIPSSQDIVKAIRLRGKFAVSVMGVNADPLAIASFDYGTPSSKLWEALDHDIIDEMPVMKHAVSFFICRVADAINVDGNTLFYAEILSMKKRKGTATPLTYSDYAEAMSETVYLVSGGDG